MSQARVYVTNKVRKDWVCGKCGAEIKKGVDGRRSFSVGFRGYEQTRCMRPECTPTRSELESSALANVYDVIDGFDFSTFTTAEDFTNARDEIVSACEEVVSEYEGNEMYEVNSDLQERAGTIQDAAGELSSWEPEDEPEEDEVDCEECNGTGKVEPPEGDEEEVDCDACDGTGTVDLDNEEFEAAHDEWLDNTRDSFQEAVDGMEFP